MHARQDMFAHPGPRLNLAVVRVTLQPQISRQAIGRHNAAGLHRLGDESVKRRFETSAIRRSRTRAMPVPSCSAAMITTAFLCVNFSNAMGSRWAATPVIITTWFNWRHRRR